MMCLGSVHAFQTNSRGASNTLVTTIRSASRTMFSAITGLLFLLLFYNSFNFFETLFPKLPIAECPIADCLDRLGSQRAHTFSSTLCLDHDPRPHQVGNMF